MKRGNKMKIFFLVFFVVLAGINNLLAQQYGVVPPQPPMQAPVQPPMQAPMQETSPLPTPLPLTKDETKKILSILNPQMDKYSYHQSKIENWKVMGRVGDMYFVDISEGGATGSTIISVNPLKSVMRKYGCYINYPIIECKETNKK